MKLSEALHTALDELRMQMLGAQVLFGFQFQGVFQDGFARIPKAARLLDILAFGPLVMTLGFLLAPTAQHRLVEKGSATQRILKTAGFFAALALATYTLAIGFDVFAVFDSPSGPRIALAVACAAVIIAVLLWYALGLGIRHAHEKARNQIMPARESLPLHEKINQMLTESRVILPGAQALLGFQFVVTMTATFASLPGQIKLIHFIALGAVLVSVILLIAPAAVHRVGYGGEDAEQMHRIGSFLITVALAPLAFGIAADVYVALAKAIADKAVAGWIACAAGFASFFFLAALWFGLPFLIRMRQGERAA
jgi:hypothetical protein